VGVYAHLSARATHSAFIGEIRDVFKWRKEVGMNWLALNERRLPEEHAVIERPGRRRITLEYASLRRADAEKLRGQFGGRIEKLQPDWLERYYREQTSASLRVGKGLTIVRSKVRNAKNDILAIPAGAAFGTGEHATTAMSLRMLEQISRGLPREWSMLDLGTGSGILALAGRRFGAARVIAIDADPIAIKTAKENAHTNDMRGIDFRVADAGRGVRSERFDVVTANLFSELLITLLPCISAMLRNNGAVILSGVLRDQERKVLRAVRASKLSVGIIRRRGKWVAILAGRGGSPNRPG